MGPLTYACARVVPTGEVRVGRCRADLVAAGPATRCVTDRLRVGKHLVHATATVDGTPITLDRRFYVREPAPAHEPVRTPAIAAARLPPPPVPFEIRAPPRVAPRKPMSITIVGPWRSATGVLAVEQIGLREVIPFTMVDGVAEVRVTPAADLGPTVELIARVALPGRGGGLREERSAQGSVQIEQDRRLQVAIAAPQRARIGETVSVQVAVTDPEGGLPDDITRFRITAIASSAVPGHAETGPARFGSAIATIATSTPLNVRAAMPRVIRPGDRATVAALVTMARDGAVEVALELPDAGLRAVGAIRKTVRGRKGTIARATFTVHASALGRPRLRLRARIAADGRALARSGAVEQPLPIEAERTQSDAVAIYGSFDDDETWALPIHLPSRALPGTGSVDIDTTTSTIGELADAADYLEHYPYGCVEQSTSRLAPLLAWANLTQRNAAAVRVAATAPGLIAHVLSMQRPDGLFDYWPGAGQVHPFASAYALWLLQLAERRGFEVPPDALARGRAAMAEQVRSDAAPTSRDHALAMIFALDALAQAGEAQAADFDALYAARGSLPVSGRMMLTMALHRAAPSDPRLPALVRGATALLEERAAVAHVVEPTANARAHWDSPTRNDALALMMLMQVRPGDGRIDGLARGIAARRQRGRWRTTQENAFALLALAEYAGRRKAAAADHRVRAWIGSRAVLDTTVRGFDATTRGSRVGLDALGEPGRPVTDTRVLLRREGRGRVHWRVGVRWTEADPQPRAQGLAVRSRILDDHGTPVTELVAGRRYRMEVAVESSTPQQFIAVELPLPAGVEADPHDLGHGIAARAASTIESRALSHLELRPDRALLFFDDLEPGTTVQQIAVTATSKGSYALPGATAEAMYEPETRARAKATRIEIVDPPAP